MDWNTLHTQIHSEKRQEPTNMFLTLKKDDVITGAFVGDPYKYYQNFELKKESETPFHGGKTRYKTNFVVNQNGVFTAKIFRFGPEAAASISELIFEYGIESLFKIKAKEEFSKGLNKTYIKPIFFYMGPLTEEQKTNLKNIKLHELKIYNAAPQVSQADAQDAQLIIDQF